MSKKKGRCKQRCRKNQDGSSAVEKAIVAKQRLNDALQSSDYILKKVFRKDGPPLGCEFDSLPSQAFHHCREGARNPHRACQENQRALKAIKVSKNPSHACQENQRALKRRKVSEATDLNCQGPSENIPAKKHGIGKGLMTKKHGIGKGLMTVWRATNPGAGDFPTGVHFAEREATAGLRISTSILRKPPVKEKRPRKQQPVKRQSRKNVTNKRKPPIRSRKVQADELEKKKQPRKGKCELALDLERCQENLDQFMLLLDDEELELRELQAGPNPLTCSAHFATNKLHGCPLCKDLLAKFPPASVTMKHPIYLPPLDSSPELVKKMFKIFHFLYTYAATIDICSFTIDEFVQAFLEKDSMLLGKIHISLLKLLLADVETELGSGCFPHACKNCNFLGLLHSVEQQEFIAKLWKKSLNPLTWTEILRQVLVAAGFGSKQGASQKEPLAVDVNPMVKYGLSPGTLKGELYSILLEQGINGLRVSDLAKFVQIVELNPTATKDELKHSISSTLSSDITLFEKISSSAYRLRINSIMKEAECSQSDSEDFGSIDSDSKNNGHCSSSDESEHESGINHLKIIKRKNSTKVRNNMLALCTEIDESHPGEAWLLGLMEGEYSDLSIEEKLNALVALVDLLSAACSIRMEDLVSAIAERAPNTSYYGSGAKLKRSSGKQQNMRPNGGHLGQMLISKEVNTSVIHPIDSLAHISKIQGNQNTFGKRTQDKERESEDCVHPMQSIFLGSDRRYNRYWLFLGPCSEYDPGHRRIYFESSEDGHWDVIDNEEALCSLLSALDRRGTREAFLLSSLEKRGACLCKAFSSLLNDVGSRQPTQSDQSELIVSREQSSSPVSDVDNNLCLTEIRNGYPAPPGAIVLESGKKGELHKQKWSSIQAFDAWIWNSFYCNLNAVKYSKKSYFDSLTRCECCHDLFWRDEKHCKTCHTTFELDFDLEERYAIHVATCRVNGDVEKFPRHKVLPSQLQSLKAAIHAIESVMPEDALVGAWKKSAHKLWVKRLRRTSTLQEFLQVLADFVGAINVDWLSQCNVDLGLDSIFEEIIASFPTMPQTSSAVALWLVKLDSLVAPHIERVCSDKQAEICTRNKGKHKPKQ